MDSGCAKRMVEPPKRIDFTIFYRFPWIWVVWGLWLTHGNHRIFTDLQGFWLCYPHLDTYETLKAPVLEICAERAHRDERKSLNSLEPDTPPDMVWTTVGESEFRVARLCFGTICTTCTFYDCVRVCTLCCCWCSIVSRCFGWCPCCCLVGGFVAC